MDFLNAHELFFARFGGDTAYWYLSDDSNALCLGPKAGDVTVTVVLDSREASLIRSIGHTETRVALDVGVDGTNLRLHLEGKKAGAQWCGIAANDPRQLDDEMPATDVSTSESTNRSEVA
jgi:cyclic di-GMP phosphodiesterase Gmr